MAVDPLLESVGPKVMHVRGKTEAKTTFSLNGRLVAVAIDFDGNVEKERVLSALKTIETLVKDIGLGDETRVSFHISKDGKIANTIINRLESEIESKEETLYLAAIDLESDFTTARAKLGPQIESLKDIRDHVLTIINKFNEVRDVDQELFTSPSAPAIKHALTEVYTAESVFLSKLEAMLDEEFLTSRDKEQLQALIANTRSILQSLTAFDQLGVKQESRLRTLRQDFATQIALKAQKFGRDQKTLKRIIALQEKIGELSGRAMHSKSEPEKKRLAAEIEALKKEMDKLVDALSKSSKHLADMYKEIQTLTQEKSKLPKVPTGLIDNLTATFSSKALEKQYELLGHFKRKISPTDPNFTKYQELLNKITRYPMAVQAVLQNIPKQLQPKALKKVHASLEEQVAKLNAL